MQDERQRIAANRGEPTGIPSLLEFLKEPWREEAACRDEPDPELFFPEASGAQYMPNLPHGGMLLTLMICAGCSVRRECLRVGLDPPGFSGGEDDLVAHAQRTFGTWGGSVEHDRWSVKDLAVEEAVEVLEGSFEMRLRARIEAWTARVTSGRPHGQAIARDRQVAVAIGREDLVPATPKTRRTIGRFHLHGQPGPGRGHNGPVAIYAEAHGVSRDTAWRRLRAQ